MNNPLSHHHDHASVLLEGDIEWPVIHDLVGTIEEAVDHHRYTSIEIRVRSRGGSNEVLGYLLERMQVWRERGCRFRTRALARTSSGAALLVALGDERVAASGATLRFHGARLYRCGDLSAEESTAIAEKLSKANDRMVRRLVERLLAGPQVPGLHGAEEADREVLQRLCVGAAPDPGNAAPAHLQVLTSALGHTVDHAIADRDREALAHLYRRLFQLDRPISPRLAATLGLLDREAATDWPPSCSGPCSEGAPA